MRGNAGVRGTAGRPILAVGSASAIAWPKAASGITVMVARPGVTVFAGWSPIRPAEPVCAMEGAGIEGRCDATVRPIGKRIRAQASEWSMFVTRVKKATPTATHLRIGYLHDTRRQCPIYPSKGLCRSLAFDEFGCGRAGNVRFDEDTARGQTGRALSFQDVDP
jgi:hypothetical protein